MTPIILDFTEQDAALRRAAGRTLLWCAIAAALLVGSIVGPLIVREHARIADAICAGEEVV